MLRRICLNKALHNAFLGDDPELVMGNVVGKQ